MSEQETVTTNSRLSSQYNIGRHIYTTRTSEGFEAQAVDSEDRVVIWNLRYQLNRQSESAERFIQRLQLISSLPIAVSPLHGFGVEGSGYAYAVTEFAPGVRLAGISGSIDDVSRKFLEAVTIVAELHRHGIVLGDICDDSFIVKRESGVVLQAVLGTFEVEARNTAILPAIETLHYLAPEQRSGSSAMPASDVYALGVLGYRLLTGKFPLGDRSPASIPPDEDPLLLAPAPTVVRGELPMWVDDLLGRCVELKLESRYADAAQFEADLIDAVRLGKPSRGFGRWSRRTMIVRPKSEGIRIHQGDVEKEAQRQSEREEGLEQQGVAEEDFEPAAKSKLPLIIGGFLGAGLIVAAIFAIVIDLGKSEPKKVVEESGVAQVPPQLKPFVVDLISREVGLEQRRIALAQLIESEEPSTFSILVDSVKKIDEPALRLDVYRAIVNRLKDVGLVRSADVMSRWMEAGLNSGINPSNAVGYDLFFRASDVTLPLEARRDALHRSFAQDKSTSLQLAAALAIDDTDPEHFVPVVREFLLSSGGGSDLEGRGIGALIFSDRMLTYFFDRDLIGLLPTMGPGDLAWSATKLAVIDSPLLSDVVRETIRRKLVPSFQGVFLDSLTKADPAATSREVKIALVKASTGQMSESELISLSQWTDLRQLERVLLATMAVTNSAKLSVDAFDALSARGASTEPASSLIEWVKTKLVEHRAKLTKAIGILGLSELASDAEISFAFDQLMPFSASGSLLKAFVKSGNIRLMLIALDRVAQITPSDELIKLLGHPDPEVRIAVIKALGGRNEVTVLQHLARGFERESNERVKQAYQEYHWVTRGRKTMTGY